jgi:hypothetical protein
MDLPDWFDTIIPTIPTRCRGAPWRTIPLNLYQFNDHMWEKILLYLTVLSNKVYLMKPTHVE